MVKNNLSDFATEFLLLGLLIFSLIAIAFTFISANSVAVDETYLQLLYKNKINLSSEVSTSTTLISNATAQTGNTNPEIGNLGSRDQVAVAFKMKDSPTGIWNKIKLMLNIITATSIGNSGTIDSDGNIIMTDDSQVAFSVFTLLISINLLALVIKLIYSRQ